MKTHACFLRCPGIIICIIFLSTLQFAVAQSTWEFTIRPALNFPTSTFGDTKLSAGFGFEGVVSYKLMPELATTFGWGWNTFPAARSFAGEENDFVENGYMLGLQYVQQLGESDFSYMIGAGVILDHIEVFDVPGEIISDTGHGLGWQLEAGVPFALGWRMNITPGIRFRALHRTFHIGGAATPVNLNYLSAGVGFSWTI